MFAASIVAGPAAALAPGIRAPGSSARTARVAGDTSTAAPSPAAAPARPDSGSTFLPMAVDSVVEAAIRSHEVPGAALVIVKDGATVLIRGYGFANLDRRSPVSPDSTLLGVSSVSKVFTALAALALAQDGRVRLDEDVNRYLRDVRVPATWPRPVTIADLLTHSAGLDERPIGLAARTPEAIVPLGAFLARDLPPRVRPPAEVASYSNHGFALAGLVVEQASGTPFADYVARRVLAPLGMRHSSFAQPLPAPLEALRATGYQKTDTGWRRVPRIYFNDAPASALFTTARDMARFLAASLPADPRAGSPVLDGEWLATTYRRQFAHHPRFPGLAYGFRERFFDGWRVLQQGGDWQDYSSELYLVPGERLGVFIAFNTGEGNEVGERVWREVLKHFAGDGFASDALGSAGPDSMRTNAPTADGPELDAPFSVDGDALAGTYRLNRYSRSTIGRVAVLAGAVTDVKVEARGDSLHALGTTLHPIAPFLFRRADSGALVAFRTDSSGRATHLFAENSPYVAFERVGWIDSVTTHVALLAGGVVVLLSALIVAPVAFARRGAAAPRDYGRATLSLALATSLVAVGVVAAFGVLLLRTDSWVLQYELPATIRVALVSSLLVPALASALAARVGAAWMRGEWGVPLRLHHSLLVAAAFAVALFLFSWRLVAFRA